MIADCRGLGNPGNTPSTSTPNSSVDVPEKTVLPTPFMPGLISSTGIRAAEGGADPACFCPKASEAKTHSSSKNENLRNILIPTSRSIGCGAQNSVCGRKVRDITGLQPA